LLLLAEGIGGGKGNTGWQGRGKHMAGWAVWAAESQESWDAILLA
jgi:hypothetical protein